MELEEEMLTEYYYDMLKDLKGSGAQVPAAAVASGQDINVGLLQYFDRFNVDTGVLRVTGILGHGDTGAPDLRGSRMGGRLCRTASSRWPQKHQHYQLSLARKNFKNTF